MKQAGPCPRAVAGFDHVDETRDADQRAAGQLGGRLDVDRVANPCEVGGPRRPRSGVDGEEPAMSGVPGAVLDVLRLAQIADAQGWRIESAGIDMGRRTFAAEPSSAR